MDNIGYYQLHRLTYNHCIAFAKLITLVINNINNQDFFKKHDLKLLSDRCVVCDKIASGSYQSRIGVRFVGNSINRIGNLGTIDTHCLTYNIYGNIISFDGTFIDSLLFSDLDYSEEFFFQNSLLYEGNALIYMIVFPYLRKHCHYDFELDSGVDFIKFCSIIPEIKGAMQEEGLWGTVLDLYKMADEKFNTYDKEMWNRIE